MKSTQPAILQTSYKSSCITSFLLTSFLFDWEKIVKYVIDVRILKRNLKTSFLQ